MFQIKDEIRELIRCSIERIIQGYIVRHQEADGCDEYDSNIGSIVICGQKVMTDEATEKRFFKNTQFINNE